MGAEAAYLPALISAIGGIGSAGIQSSAASDAAARQAGMTKEMYDADRQREFEAAQYLKDLLPNFNTALPDPNQYFGTDAINRQFDVSSGNLNRTAMAQAAQSAGQAAAAAASRGLANPTGVTSGAFQSTLGQFAPQFGALEANRASALSANQGNLYNALLGNLQYQNAQRQLGYGNQFNLASQFGNPNVAPTPTAQKPQATNPQNQPYDPYYNPFGTRNGNPFSPINPGLYR